MGSEAEKRNKSEENGETVKDNCIFLQVLNGNTMSTGSLTLTVLVVTIDALGHF